MQEHEGRRLTEPRSSRDTGETDRPATGKAAKMPATTIHFVRHGKVENPGHLLYERLPGFHLSELGVRMAQATAHYIAVSPQLNTVSAVYSSPLERTRETAGEILESLNSVRGLRDEQPLELKTDKRLIEARNEFRGKRIGFGEGALWKNGNWKLVRNLWKPSWGETYQSIAHRMQDFALEKVYNIVDSRYRARLPMILTTNLELSDMQRASDIRYSRIYDRIFEVCYPVRFTGSSFRKLEAKKRFDEMKSFLEGDDE